MSKIRSHIIIISLLTIVGFIFGEKFDLGCYLVSRIDKEVDSIELQEAHAWDSTFEPYVKLWVKHPLVGKSASAIARTKKGTFKKFKCKYPFGLPQSDEIWVYMPGPVFYFKDKVVIGVDDGYGPHIFGACCPKLESKRHSLLQFRNWISKVCELEKPLG